MLCGERVKWHKFGVVVGDFRRKSAWRFCGIYAKFKACHCERIARKREFSWQSTSINFIEFKLWNLKSWILLRAINRTCNSFLLKQKPLRLKRFDLTSSSLAMTAQQIAINPKISRVRDYLTLLISLKSPNSREIQA